MTNTLIPNHLWAIMELLSPRERLKPKGGRPHLADLVASRRILMELPQATGAIDWRRSAFDSTSNAARKGSRSGLVIEAALDKGWANVTPTSPMLIAVATGSAATAASPHAPHTVVSRVAFASAVMGKLWKGPSPGSPATIA